MRPTPDSAASVNDAERARAMYVDEYTRRVRAEAEVERLRALLREAAIDYPGAGVPAGWGRRVRKALGDAR